MKPKAEEPLRGHQRPLRSSEARTAGCDRRRQLSRHSARVCSKAAVISSDPRVPPPAATPKICRNVCVPHRETGHPEPVDSVETCRDQRRHPTAHRLLVHPRRHPLLDHAWRYQDCVRQNVFAANEELATGKDPTKKPPQHSWHHKRCT